MNGRLKFVADTAEEEVVVESAVVAAAAVSAADIVSLPVISAARSFAAAPSALDRRLSQHRQALREALALPATTSSIIVTSAALLSAASITTIIRMTIPIITTNPPSIPSLPIPFPLLSVEEAAAEF